MSEWGVQSLSGVPMLRQIQFGFRKRLGRGAFLVNRPFEILTDKVFRIMR
jgi:hypothetical protein